MMRPTTHPELTAAAIAALALMATPDFARAQVHESAMVAISGTAAFDSSTTVPMISIHGKSTALEGRARVRQDGNSLIIEQLEAVVPVRTLSTGMGLRDEHMRKYVFTSADGSLSDVRFIADRVVCVGSAGAKRTCQLSGDLTIRNTARPFAIVLDVKNDGSAYRAVGDGIAKLSAYGIPAPSQLGVTAQDDVKVHLDFVVKRVEERIAQRNDR